MPRFRRIALGGTFDRLHVGHDALLRAAFAAGDRVAIGVTSDRYLAAHPKAAASRVLPYASRARALRRWLAARFPRRRWEVVPLEDRFGRSVEPGIDALVVTPETRAGGRAVNDERRRRGLAPLALVEVPLVLADDLRPVSSTRIRRGEIGRKGERLTPIRVGLAADAPSDATAVAAAVRRVFPRAVVVRRPARGPADGGSRPEVRSRRLARSALPGADLALGVARSRPVGWVVCLGVGELTLPPHPVRGRGRSALAGGVLHVLRPAGRQSL